MIQHKKKKKNLSTLQFIRRYDNKVGNFVPFKLKKKK